MNWSQYQLDLFEEAKNGTGHVVVKATAGSGKSSSLAQVSSILKGKSVLVLAFNKHAAAHMENKIHPNHQSRTVHSHAFSAIRNGSRGRIKVNNYKYWNIVDDIIDSMRLHRSYADEQVGEIKRSSIDIINKGRLMLIDFLDVSQVRGICDHFGIDIWGPEIQIAQKSISRGVDSTREIDFTDMLYMPVVKNMRFDKHDVILVDESQDQSALQLEVVLRSIDSDGRLIFVGDSSQCQPAGTMISMHDGSKRPIENIVLGDKLVSYDRGSGHYMRRALVAGVARRPFSGWMYTVEAGGEKTQATDNHKWLVKWENMNTDKYATYIMRKGNNYRIGMTQMFVNSNKHRRNNRDIGVGARMRSEKADAGWIIGIHDNYVDAYSHEQSASQAFGIPQLTFAATNGSRLTQEEIDEIYDQFDDLGNRAAKCLEAHGKNILYPLISRLNRQRRGGSTYFVTESCNLIDGFMSIPVPPKDIIFYPKTSFKNDWHEIRVSKEWREEVVYSLDVNKYELYVADNVITHNSINGFAGAMVDSMDMITRKTNAKVMPLSVCYRCPITHIDLAKELDESIEPAPNAQDGNIIDIDEFEFPQFVSRGDLIVCRINAPLIGFALKLIQQGLPARVKGRDTAKELVSTVKKVKKISDNFDDVYKTLHKWRDSQVAKLRKKEYSETAIERIHDTSDCIEAFVDGGDAHSWDDLIEKINSLFADDGASIWLSSVHRAKGLEADNVFILKPHKMPLMWANQKEWERQQEQNILFVALTRAKQNLYFVHEAS